MRRKLRTAYNWFRRFVSGGNTGMQLHVRRHLGSWGNSFALLAGSEAPRTAVVFVHGFHGDAESTWIHFQALIDRCSVEYPHWQDCDVFFWEYDSVSLPLRITANKLGKFL